MLQVVIVFLYQSLCGIDNVSLSPPPRPATHCPDSCARHDEEFRVAVQH